jgi:hypothetical protein
MIMIQTVNSKIYDNRGNPVTGKLIIAPNVEFEYTEFSTPNRRKVTLEPVEIAINNGVIASFQIAPTLNANHDKSNLYYVVRVYTQSTDYTEYWVIDTAGAPVLEFTDITLVNPDPFAQTAPLIPADDVTAVPTANKIPRAQAGGKLALGWIPVSLGSPVASFVQPNRPSPDPVPNELALWFDTAESQFKVWDGVDWRTFA